MHSVSCKHVKSNSKSNSEHNYIIMVLCLPKWKVLSCQSVVCYCAACPEQSAGTAPWIIALGIIIPLLILGFCLLLILKLLLLLWVRSVPHSLSVFISQTMYVWIDHIQIPYQTTPSWSFHRPHFTNHTSMDRPRPISIPWTHH